MENIYKKFENVADFHKYLLNGETQDGFREDSKRKGHAFWHGTGSWEEAENLLLNGDREHAERIEEGGLSRERMRIRLSETRRKTFTNVTGFAPCVPNYLANVPKSMYETRTVRVKQKVVNVVYNCTNEWSVDSEEMVKAAVKMLSAVLRVESAGVRVNLYVVAASSCDVKRETRQTVGVLVRVKSSGQHLDVLRTAYPLTNTSMLRRHFLRFIETTNGVHRRFSGGYGTPVKDASNILDGFGVKQYTQLHYNNMKDKDIKTIANEILGGGANK